MAWRWRDLSVGLYVPLLEFNQKHKLAEGWGREEWGIANWIFLGFQRTWVTRVTGFWHTHGYKMTKTELQSALAEATQTDKKTAGVFIDTLSALAYKEIKKTGEFVLPGFGKLVKQKRKARTGFNPKTQQKIKIPAKTVVKFRVAKAAKDGVFGVKK
jgi:DNA-binding protein HU-beta